MDAHSLISFLDAVEHSFLADDEKKAFAEAAKQGVTQQLWNDFNDRLIASIVHTQEQQHVRSFELDREIDKYTADYEREKVVIDREFRAMLAAVPEADAAEKDRLWAEYGVRIRALQKKLLEEVRQTSTTVLHDVMLAVMPGGAPQ
jgi:hypothetical protein